MKKVISILLSLVFLVSLTACTDSTKGEDASKENKENFRIITSFYPVYVATLNLIDGAEGVSIETLTDTMSGCIHDYVLTSDDVEKMEGADLFIASGMGMENFVGNVSLGVPGLETLDCGEDIDVIIGEYEEKQSSHYWLNIDNAAEQCEKIRRTLARKDPANADIYNKNAAAYTEKLMQLKAEADTRLSALTKKPLVVFDDTFDYFAQEFGFETRIVSPGSEDAPVSGFEIDRAVRYMKENGIDFVLISNELQDKEAYKAIVNETGCKTYIIDLATSGATGDNAKNAYIDAMQKNIEILESALA